jgi:hypothetical protein
MNNKALIATLALAITFCFTAAGYAYSEDIVASLDGKSVTVENLTTYVEEVAGSNYQAWLGDREGLRKLADFYINRSLLLEYAKKNLKNDDSIVKNHTVRSVDKDVMYLTSLLKAEVQDKVLIAGAAVSAYMLKKKITTEKQARQELESDKKNELMGVLVEKVRSGHEIVYY